MASGRPGLGYSLGRPAHQQEQFLLPSAGGHLTSSFWGRLLLFGVETDDSPGPNGPPGVTQLFPMT